MGKSCGSLNHTNDLSRLRENSTNNHLQTHYGWYESSGAGLAHDTLIAHDNHWRFHDCSGRGIDSKLPDRRCTKCEGLKTEP